MTEGQILAGRYELGAVLGRGGMAEVRAGWDLRLGRAVAIKTLLPDLAERPGVRRSFEGEAHAAARLAHPNAVAVFDVGEEEGVPFLVMEQIDGPTLEEELAGGPLEVGRVRRLGEELLGALGAAHATGLVHRDVKPSNVLMTSDGSAKVADFGIAKAVVDEGSATQMDLTATGQVVGTVAYMAPERLTGQPATVQSDLYSVGVVLYEALTGTRPFAAASPIAMVRAIDEASPAPLAERRPGVDAALVATVERAMAKSPRARFASAAEMSAALRVRAEATVAKADDALTLVAGPATDILDAPPTGRPSASPATSASGRPGGDLLARRSGRRWIYALVVIGVLAVAALVVVVPGDEDQTSPSTTPSTGPSVTAPVTPSPSTAGGGIPALVDDALRRLEETVR